MNQWMAALASVFGLTAVALGAFAAHGLKSRLSEASLAVFQTGVTYQFYHTLALLAVAIVAAQAPTRWWSLAAILFSVGIVFFSGSLYALALTGIKWFGPITPLGGLCFMAGWLCLLIGVVRQ
ncbi:DUF423 domain-containing protein [Idiomarina xiamenensis]|uniref:DUF423 domain-containing protein n=1 Tax=Idiomarina xiamenensis 10-D-4 TaxID=740709 RepID=K2KDR3_9GAMM|nr:DUF423 domain-containing protein [Idiomarina xiamenensis]EKE84872.1 hypothetical protein A10D4_04650 [Idiomarina xiamenensis 10-D-4]